jgi:hypothetical protein
VSGLKSGDVVITAGLPKLRPGVGICNLAGAAGKAQEKAPPPGLPPCRPPAK